MNTRRLRVLLALHGFRPEMRGGTEATVEALALGLVDESVEVVVLAGSDGGERATLVREPDSRPGLRLYRYHRGDLHYGHWNKAGSPAAGRAFEEVLRRERPDVVHVHHWSRLTRDLVQRAARLGVPAVVTLHDLSVSCLVHFRVRPDDLSFCERPLAPDPCLACAAQVFPATPWLTPGEERHRLDRLRDDSREELRLARVVIALCSDQARLLETVLGLEVPIRVVSPASDERIEPAEPPAHDPGEERPLALGCWATLHRLKGTDLLVEAVRQLVHAEVPVTLELAGAEGERAWVDGLRASAAGLPVRFHGPFDRLAQHPVTRVHAFVAGTHARETWGVVLDEALRLRLPMVLPRFGAYAERFQEERGVLFYERGNARALAAVLGRLQREPGLVRRLRGSLPPSGVLPTRSENLRRNLEAYEAAIRLGAPPAPPLDPAREAAEEAYLARWDAAYSCGASNAPRS